MASIPDHVREAVSQVSSLGKGGQRGLNPFHPESVGFAQVISTYGQEAGYLARGRQLISTSWQDPFGTAMP